MANNSIANNILSFPKKDKNTENINGLPTNLDEVKNLIQNYKDIHIQEVIEIIIPVLFNQFQYMGFSPPDDEEFCIKDTAIIVESLRSFMRKMYGLEHPIQKIADSLFLKDKDNSYKMADIVNIVTKLQE